MLTVRLAEVLEVVYSRGMPSIKLDRGSADYTIMETIWHWANGDCESDPGCAWITANCSSRPPARLADIMMATLGMPDYRTDQPKYVRTKGLTRVLAAVMASQLRHCTVWARDNDACLDDKRAQADLGTEAIDVDCMTGVIEMKPGMPRGWLTEKCYALASDPLTAQTVACNAPYVTLFGDSRECVSVCEGDVREGRGRDNAKAACRQAESQASSSLVIPQPKQRSVSKKTRGKLRRGGRRVKERRAFLEAVAGGVSETAGDAAVEAALGSARGAAVEAALRSAGDATVEAALRSAGDAAVEAALGSAGDAAVEAAFNSAGDAAVEAALRSAADAAVEAALRSAGDAAVEAALDSALGSAGDAAVEAALDSAGDAAVEAALGSAGDAAVEAALNSAGGAFHAALPSAGAALHSDAPASGATLHSDAPTSGATFVAPSGATLHSDAPTSGHADGSSVMAASRSWCLTCTCLSAQRMAASWHRSSKSFFGCHGWCITPSSAGAALWASPASAAQDATVDATQDIAGAAAESAAQDTAQNAAAVDAAAVDAATADAAAVNAVAVNVVAVVAATVVATAVNATAVDSAARNAAAMDASALDAATVNAAAVDASTMVAAAVDAAADATQNAAEKGVAVEAALGSAEKGAAVEAALGSAGDSSKFGRGGTVTYY